MASRQIDREGDNLREHNLTGIETTLNIFFLNENIRYKRKRLKRARIKFRNNSDTR